MVVPQACVISRGAAPIRAALFATVIAVALTFPATSSAEPYRDTALALTQRLVALFPPAEGYVVSIPGNEVFIDIAEADLVKPGMEMMIYREGDEIMHPLTGDVLGTYEDKLGYLSIREVREKYSVGILSAGAREIHPGDRVRISARPLRILLLFTGESPAMEIGRMARFLQEAMGESNRFRLSDEPEWLPRLNELQLTIDEALADAAALQRLGEGAKADLLLNVLPPRGDDAAVVFDIRSLWTGRTMIEFRRDWAAAPAPAPIAEKPSRRGLPFSIFSRSEEPPSKEKKEYVGKDLPGGVLSLQAGDFRGDGLLDIMVSDGRKLTLYTWEAGGLIWKWEDEGSPAQRILHLDSGDLDGDGKPEILIIRASHGVVRTEALSWSAGEWNKIAEAPALFLRMLETGTGDSVLLGQRFGIDTVFSGPVREYALEGETFAPVEGTELPRGIDIFGLGLADLDGDGTAEFLSLNDEGNIIVTDSTGERIYRGRERFGGYPSPIARKDLFGPNVTDGNVSQGYFTADEPNYESGKSATEELRTFFKGRIENGRTGNGEVFVLLPANLQGPGKLLPTLRSHNRGEAAILRWEEGGFIEVVRSRRQDGYIADALLADVDGDGREDVLMAIGSTQGFLQRARGNIVVWRFNPVEGIAGGGD